MARGDITVTLSANLANDGTVDHQPGSGVEAMITGSVGEEGHEGTTPNVVPAVNILIIDGTNNLSIIDQGNAGNGAELWLRDKHLATNTNYFRFQNKQGSSGDLTFAVMDVG